MLETHFEKIFSSLNNLIITTVNSLNSLLNNRWSFVRFSRISEKGSTHGNFLQISVTLPFPVEK